MFRFQNFQNLHFCAQQYLYICRNNIVKHLIQQTSGMENIIQNYQVWLWLFFEDTFFFWLWLVWTTLGLSLKKSWSVKISLEVSKLSVSPGHALVETRILSWGGAEGISKYTLFSSVRTGLLTRKSAHGKLICYMNMMKISHCHLRN